MSGIQIHPSKTKTFNIVQYYLVPSKNLELDRQGITRIFAQNDVLHIGNISLFKRAIVILSKDATRKPPQKILETPGFHDYITGCRRLLYPNDQSIKSCVEKHSPIDLFKKSADESFGPALFMLNYLHLNGLVGEKNETMASTYALNAACQNFPPAQLYVAYRFLNGDYGFTKNVDTAAKWFKKAEANGLPRGDFEICYFTGRRHTSVRLGTSSVSTISIPKARTIPKLPVVTQFKNFSPLTSIPKPNIPVPSSNDILFRQLFQAQVEAAELRKRIAEIESRHKEEVFSLKTHITTLENALENRNIDESILQWLYNSAQSKATEQIITTQKDQELSLIPLPEVIVDHLISAQERSTPKRAMPDAVQTSKRQRVPLQK